jgi:serine phosphatase RsbU (regulator of sigma subunit)
MEIVSAGHPPPLLICPDEAAIEMPSGQNLPLGLEQAELVVAQRQLEKGYLLALYTDGLSEMSDKDSQMLGIDGLRLQLKSICTDDLSAVGAAQELSRRLDALLGDRAPADDRTFLLVRRR